MTEHIPKWAYESVEIKNYDKNWKKSALKEKERLLSVLEVYDVLAIEHIGSTAIQDMAAKPIIDLMISLENFNRIDQINEILSEYNYHYVPPFLDGNEYRRFFVKVKDDKRIVHIHFMIKGEKRWEEQLKFRDILNGNEKLRSEYKKLKLMLSRKYKDDREEYTKQKSAFINKVLYS